jgi:hypothetical protein
MCGVLPGAVYNLLGSEEGEKNERGSEFLCILKVPSTGEWGQEHRSQQEGDSTNGSTSTGTSTGCPKGLVSSLSTRGSTGSGCDMYSNVRARYSCLTTFATLDRATKGLNGAGTKAPIQILVPAPV